MVGFLDGSFESPVVAGFEGEPAGSPWAFEGDSGIVGSGGAFPVVLDGAQSCFLAGGSSVSQAVDFGLGGSFSISGLCGGWYSNPSNAAVMSCSVDGASVGAIVPTLFEFTGFAVGPFAVSAGSHTVTFAFVSGYHGYLDALTIADLTPRADVARPARWVPPLRFRGR